MVLDTRLPAHPARGEVEASEALIREARQRARRRRLRYAISAVVLVVAATGGGLAVGGGGDSPPVGASQAQHPAPGYVEAPGPVDPVRPPGLVGTGAVWYDAGGLHHGGVVERTPVELVADNFEGIGSVFALVRHGAVYRDPATDDVWFHPWGGRPRVVGHGSATGPGGDPESDVAAWFEGNELVVFDTARGEEISRTTEEAWALVPSGMSSEHVRDSNGFVHVSPTEVVWVSENDSGWQGMRRLVVETGTSSVVWEMFGPTGVPMPSDVHDTTRITPLLGDDQGDSVSLLIDAAEKEQLRLDNDNYGVEPMGRLSPDGTFVLAPMYSQDVPDFHGAAIVDLRTRVIWKLPLTESYVWIAWSYDDLAVIKVDRDDKTRSTLLACDAVARECDRLPHHGRVLLPAS